MLVNYFYSLSDQENFCVCVSVCVHMHTHTFLCTRNLCAYILLSLVHDFWSKRLLAYLIFIIIILPWRPCLIACLFDTSP